MTEYSEEKLFEIIKKLVSEKRYLKERVETLEQELARRNSVQNIMNSMELRKLIEKLKNILGEENKYLLEE